jgi:hypothetical protein
VSEDLPGAAAAPILNPDGSWGMTAGQFVKLLRGMRKPVIRNLTPHPIQIYSRDDTDLALVHFGPDEVLPVAGVPARLAMVELGTKDHNGVVYELVEYGPAHSLPEPEPGVWLVVSLPVALACGPSRTDLLVPYREVRDENGTVAGCRMLARPVWP